MSDDWRLGDEEAPVGDCCDMAEAALRERLASDIEALPEYVFAEPWGIRLDKADVLRVVRGGGAA